MNLLSIGSLFSAVEHQLVLRSRLHRMMARPDHLNVSHHNAALGSPRSNTKKTVSWKPVRLENDHSSSQSEDLDPLARLTCFLLSRRGFKGPAKVSRSSNGHNHSRTDVIVQIGITHVIATSS